MKSFLLGDTASTRETMHIETAKLALGGNEQRLCRGGRDGTAPAMGFLAADDSSALVAAAPLSRRTLLPSPRQQAAAATLVTAKVAQAAPPSRESPLSSLRGRDGCASAPRTVPTAMTIAPAVRWAPCRTVRNHGTVGPMTDSLGSMRARGYVRTHRTCVCLVIERDLLSHDVQIS